MAALELVAAPAEAGADLIVCVSNTMHRVVEPIIAARETPFIHIADPTGESIRSIRLRRVGLLGTMPVMRSQELQARFRNKFGVEIITPAEADGKP